jgi:hypothetical protein
MKNLFYVCLVAMLSLGSTGLTTVEETGSSTADSCDFSCGEISNQVFREVFDETNGNGDYAGHVSTSFFSFCNGAYCDMIGGDYLW